MLPTLPASATDLLDENRLIHVNRKDLDQADRWFARHGSATVFFAIVAGFICWALRCRRDRSDGAVAMHPAQLR